MTTNKRKEQNRLQERLRKNIATGEEITRLLELNISEIIKADDDEAKDAGTVGLRGRLRGTALLS
ncbi:hypothetical protein [Microvirga massiliensis]|uniref:hypothetical protein n=1 Tax=Microvirga massiliensis TaxID=1033741 RepID=UPI0011C6EA36|nr:hypothetical protein [Microvirga massiliensis]